jgi:hypothetical protein
MLEKCVIQDMHVCDSKKISVLAAARIMKTVITVQVT